MSQTVEASKGVLWPSRWFCIDCERILTKPPFREGKDRFHSWRCQTPLKHVEVFIREISSGDSAG